MNKKQSSLPFHFYIGITIYIIIAMMYIGGCTQTQKEYFVNSSMVGVETNVLTKQYDKVEKLLRLQQKEKKVFSEEEWNKLLNVDSSIDLLIMKYNAMLRLDMSSVDILDVDYMWRLAKTAYLEGKDVIYAHWDEYNLSTKLLLEAFDQQAKETDKRITELLQNPNNKSINESLTLIMGMVTLGVKMLGAVAVL